MENSILSAFYLAVEMMSKITLYFNIYPSIENVWAMIKSAARLSSNGAWSQNNHCSTNMLNIP